MPRMDWTKYARSHGGELIRVFGQVECHHCHQILNQDEEAVWKEEDPDQCLILHPECFKARIEGSSPAPAA